MTEICGWEREIILENEFGEERRTYVHILEASGVSRLVLFDIVMGSH